MWDEKLIAIDQVSSLALTLSKFDLRLPELDLKLQLRLVAILRSKLGVGLFE